MTCDCLHNNICPHRQAIANAFRPVLPVIFGPCLHGSWGVVAEVLETYCQHRLTQASVVAEHLAEVEAKQPEPK